MAQKQAYRLRIRTTTTDPGAARWIITHRLYSLPRLMARMEQLRRQGRVVHWDEADWHDRHGTS